MSTLQFLQQGGLKVFPELLRELKFLGEEMKAQILFDAFIHLGVPVNERSPFELLEGSRRAHSVDDFLVQVKNEESI